MKKLHLVLGVPVVNNNPKRLEIVRECGVASTITIQSPEEGLHFSLYRSKAEEIAVTYQAHHKSFIVVTKDTLFAFVLSNVLSKYIQEDKVKSEELCGWNVFFDQSHPITVDEFGFDFTDQIEPIMDELNYREKLIEGKANENS